LRISTIVVASTLALVGLAVQKPVEASNPPLACTVVPAGTSIGCTTNDPSSEYSVRLQVPNPQVPNYSWAYTDIDKGTKHTLNCTTSTCYFSVGAGGHDVFWDIEANDETGRNATTYETTLDIPAVCGGGSYFC
jgi:hypothetical protein